MSLNKGILATALVVLLVAGCSKVVDGRAVIAVPRPGTPVQWAPCESANPLVQIPPDAECGKLSVPVDYSKPDGDVAQLAMIRFKATGEKIGSLVINPGGPGESGVESAVNLMWDAAGTPCANASTWSASTRAGSRRRRPRCGATPTPTTTGCGPTPRSTIHPQASSTSRTRPRQFVQRCVDKAGKEFLANVGTANVVKDLDAIRVAVGDEKLTYPRLLVRHPDRRRLRRTVPAERAGDDPRRRDRPQCRSDRGRHPPGGGLPAGVRRLRRRLRQGPELSAGYRPRQGRRHLQEPDRPAGGKARQDDRIRAASPTATRWSAPSCRCTRRASGPVSPTV